MRPILSLAALALVLPSTLHALPGERQAVLAHCGEPQAQNETVSQVTGKPQRDLLYKNLTLHFEPLEGGWSFTTGWEGHFPVTRSELERQLPCFRSAMQEVAAATPQVIDPTIAAQTTDTAPMVTSTWGIPHLWSIALLVLAVVLIVAWPRRKRQVLARSPEERIYRRPILRGRVFRRKPKDSPIL